MNCITDAQITGKTNRSLLELGRLTGRTDALSPQFYKCFLILFHCDHWSADNGNTSMPSKTTVIHLNRRVDNTTVACAAQMSTDTLNHCCSTPASKHTSPPRGSD